jgi:hypothetical protein
MNVLSGYLWEERVKRRNLTGKERFPPLDPGGIEKWRQKRREFPVNWGDPDVVKLKWMDGVNAVKIELERVKESNGPFCNTAGEI